MKKVRRRRALSAEAIIAAAVRVADRGGIGQVSMRHVGEALGVEAMSLYHHLSSKGVLLDALADWVFTQIDLPDAQRPWRQAMIERAASARRALTKHPWALTLVESRRAPGKALLRHHEAVLACLRANRFSLALASQAFSAIDAYVYGFVLTELKLPFAPDETPDEFVGELRDLLSPSDYPNLVALIAEQVSGKDYRYAQEFEVGLDFILDSLERRLKADRRGDRRR
jgi:AcrR family transcriptional regulator